MDQSLPEQFLTFGWGLETGFGIAYHDCFLAPISETGAGARFH